MSGRGVKTLGSGGGSGGRGIGPACQIHFITLHAASLTSSYSISGLGSRVPRTVKIFVLTYQSRQASKACNTMVNNGSLERDV